VNWTRAYGTCVATLVIVLLANRPAMSDGAKAASASGPVTENREPRCRVGALGPDGITIDPLRLPRARQVWEPKTPSASHPDIGRDGPSRPGGGEATAVRRSAGAIKRR
jgi:hypothetical protein